MVGNVFRGYPHLLKLLCILTNCIILCAYIRHIKISKKLKKYDDTEIVNKKTSDKLWVTNIIILIGWITLLIITIIGSLIYVNNAKKFISAMLNVDKIHTYRYSQQWLFLLLI